MCQTPNSKLIESFVYLGIFICVEVESDTGLTGEDCESLVIIHSLEAPLDEVSGSSAEETA